MRLRFITQLILIVITVIIAVMYIQPRIIELQTVQTETAQYADAVNKAAEFNRLLNGLLNEADTLSVDEEKILETYLPQTLDTVAVARDIENIASFNGLLTNSIQAGVGGFSGEGVVTMGNASFDGDIDSLEQTRDLRNKLHTQSISANFSGEYEAFKSFLRDTEANSYPLRVVNLSLQPVSAEEAEASQQLQYSVTFEVYSLMPSE